MPVEIDRQGPWAFEVLPERVEDLIVAAQVDGSSIDVCLRFHQGPHVLQKTFTVLLPDRSDVEQCNALLSVCGGENSLNSF